LNRAAYAIIAVVVIVIVVVGGFFLYQQMQAGSNTGGGGTTIDVYAAEYGFGSSASSIGSPGPTLTFTAGQTVTINFHNVGTGVHNWAITKDKVDGSTNYAFNGAQIGTASNPIAAGSSQSVTFTVGQQGNYYYICQVDGHVSLGMWGNVVVNP
jgi:plastocyanin